MISTGASVVTSPGSISRCKEVLTVILYKIREVGLWLVFLHLAMRDYKKRVKVTNPEEKSCPE